MINQPNQEAGPEHTHAASGSDYIPRHPTPGDPLASIRWRSLVTLSISGGLIPCLDAIAILPIAITLNRIAIGLSLIVAFSAGLAVILIGIGMVIVQGK